MAPRKSTATTAAQQTGDIQVENVVPPTESGTITVDLSKLWCIEKGDKKIGPGDLRQFTMPLRTATLKEDEREIHKAKDYSFQRDDILNILPFLIRFILFCDQCHDFLESAERNNWAVEGKVTRTAKYTDDDAHTLIEPGWSGPPNNPDVEENLPIDYAQLSLKYQLFLILKDSYVEDRDWMITQIEPGGRTDPRNVREYIKNRLQLHIWDMSGDLTKTMAKLIDTIHEELLEIVPYNATDITLGCSTSINRLIENIFLSEYWQYNKEGRRTLVYNDPRQIRTYKITVDADSSKFNFAAFLLFLCDRISTPFPNPQKITPAPKWKIGFYNTLGTCFDSASGSGIASFLSKIGQEQSVNKEGSFLPDDIRELINKYADFKKFAPVKKTDPEGGFTDPNLTASLAAARETAKAEAKAAARTKAEGKKKATAAGSAAAAAGSSAAAAAGSSAAAAPSTARDSKFSGADQDNQKRKTEIKLVYTPPGRGTRQPIELLKFDYYYDIEISKDGQSVAPSAKLSIQRFFKKTFTGIEGQKGFSDIEKIEDPGTAGGNKSLGENQPPSKYTETQKKTYNDIVKIPDTNLLRKIIGVPNANGSVDKITKAYPNYSDARSRNQIKHVVCYKTLGDFGQILNFYDISRQKIMDKPPPKDTAIMINNDSLDFFITFDMLCSRASSLFLPYTIFENKDETVALAPLTAFIKKQVRDDPGVAALVRARHDLRVERAEQGSPSASLGLPAPPPTSPRGTSSSSASAAGGGSPFSTLGTPGGGVRDERDAAYIMGGGTMDMTPLLGSAASPSGGGSGGGIERKRTTDSELSAAAGSSAASLYEADPSLAPGKKARRFLPSIVPAASSSGAAPSRASAASASSLAARMRDAVGRGGPIRRKTKKFGEAYNKLKNTSIEIIKNKLKSVGILITKVTNTGKRVPLTKKELERKAMVFTKLQMAAKNKGIRITYKAKNGSRKYKSFKRLLSDIKKYKSKKMPMPRFGASTNKIRGFDLGGRPYDVHSKKMAESLYKNCREAPGADTSREQNYCKYEVYCNNIISPTNDPDWRGPGTVLNPVLGFKHEKGAGANGNYCAPVYRTPMQATTAGIRMGEMFGVDGRRRGFDAFPNWVKNTILNSMQFFAERSAYERAGAIQRIQQARLNRERELARRAAAGEARRRRSITFGPTSVVTVDRPSSARPSSAPPTTIITGDRPSNMFQLLQRNQGGPQTFGKSGIGYDALQRPQRVLSKKEKIIENGRCINDPATLRSSRSREFCRNEMYCQNLKLSKDRGHIGYFYTDPRQDTGMIDYMSRLTPGCSSLYDTKENATRAFTRGRDSTTSKELYNTLLNSHEYFTNRTYDEKAALNHLIDLRRNRRDRLIPELVFGSKKNKTKAKTNKFG